ncbi:MAG: alanine--tRNA ligase [Anaerolineae bacterium]|nr:alanine--tRNA ligase [Anaerolineae bacterium]
MKPTSSNEIRQAFLDFFYEVRHEIVPSAPLPNFGNPTLLFTNAGMNQFVDLFLGKEKRPYSRATTSQKCMRVQGKHNDLENVGPSPRHHTFFEMLGNFSFGDYFKQDAIRFAYDFLTKVCGIDPNRLWYTVHTSDDDAERIWVQEVGVPAERVLRMGDKTNFWMMGDIGPCGPTSEIHYDWGPAFCDCGEPDCGVLLDNGCGRWLEVWNLVFMQFNQDEQGNRTPLPKPGVDTGMGLERLTAVMQNAPSNYDTDLFTLALDKVQQLLGDSHEQRTANYVGYRVIGDHGRAATFMIADGVRPGNTGASYVLRMVIRRAARFGRKIGFTQPFLADVAQVFIEQMGEAYPELRARQEHIKHTLTQEEERFARTLDAGLAQLNQIMALLEQQNRTEIDGQTAFDLYATHGLPLEITRDVVQEQGYTVDEKGFAAAREAHAIASGSGAFGQYATGDNVYGRLLNQLHQTEQLEEGVEYDPYSGSTLESEILGLIINDQITDSAGRGDKVQVVTAATCFYIEAGGEVSDTGWIRTPSGEMRVDDTQQPVRGLIVHIGEIIKGGLQTGQLAHLQVDDRRRRDIRRNHTATHILHQELRTHLGTHVTQAGSLVAPDRLRFDFSHGQGVDRETLSRIETAINEAVLADYAVTIAYMGQKEAIAAGAMALFGEKYGDIVRTVQIGAEQQPRYSFELCGGLHVGHTGDIGLFRFVSEGAVSAGVRRVEAVTGHGAQQLVAERLNLLDRLSHTLNTPIPALEQRLESLITENRSLQKEIERLQREQAKGQLERLLSQVQQVAGVNLLTTEVQVASVDNLREMADWFRDKVGSGVIVLGAVIEARPQFIAAVTEDLIPRGLKAGDLIREVARVVGGGGGGRPNLAQAGGKDASKMGEALAIVPGLILAAIKQL